MVLYTRWYIYLEWSILLLVIIIIVSEDKILMRKIDSQGVATVFICYCPKIVLFL